MSDWTLTAKAPQRVTSMTKNIPHIIALSLHYPWIPITRFWSSARSGLFSHSLSHMFVDEKIFESYFSDQLTFLNIRSRASHRIYRLSLPLRAPETLSLLSKSRIFIFNVHLTLFVRRMTSHNSIVSSFSKLTWNLYRYSRTSKYRR